MRYRIGLVSKLVGLSAEGLRLYERDGILSPRREEGSYRYYEHLDITALMRARSYQKYGFSLRETENLVNSDDLSLIQSSCRRREQALEEEIAYKQALLACLRENEALIQALPRTLGRFTLGRRPALYRLEFLQGDDLILPKEMLDTFQRWTGLAPFAFPSLRTRWEALTEGRDESFSALALLARDVQALGVEELAAAGVYYPPCPALYTVLQVRGEGASAADYLAPLVEHVRRQGLSAAGDPIAHTFLSMNKRREYTRYREVWLPIQSDAPEAAG